MNEFSGMYYLPSVSNILRDGLEADVRRGRSVDIHGTLSRWLDLPHAVSFDGHLLVASGVATAFFALAEQEPGYPVGQAFDAYQGLAQATEEAAEAGIPVVEAGGEQYLAPAIVTAFFKALIADGVVTPLADEAAWTAAFVFDVSVLLNEHTGPETLQ